MPLRHSDRAAAIAPIPGFEIVATLNETPSRVVYRAIRAADGLPVVIKTLSAQYPRKTDVAELRREFQIVRALELDGVIRMHSLESWGAGNVAIVMEPFGRSLADCLLAEGPRSIPLARFLDLAIRIAEALGQVHERDVVHKDVVPRNILLDDAGAVRLIDFGIASELARERQGVTLARRLEGSLPYISPEQTGRMNRDVDYRSDYYSLGVTFFELLTGELPFHGDTALEWVHRHISMPAPAATSRREGLPQVVSDIVLKLMSKNSEDRYQSTYGLIEDLARCRDALRAAGSIAPFPLGERDVSRRFQIPSNLYGREAELAQLGELFAGVAGGRTELCLVSGGAGVGKSALVNELSKAIVRETGYLIQGKFDQFQQSSAYFAFAQAFRGLVQQLLGEPPEQLAAWRASLLLALGPNGQLIVALIPELEGIIGPQPPVPELPPKEASHRFQFTFLNFVRVFADERHPLVVFMDDLQWSDAPTLTLIQRLVTAREMTHLLVIGAYRSNHVGPGHLLPLMLAEVQRSRPVTELNLQALDRAAADRLVADTVHDATGRSAGLSAVLYEKSQGNPFFFGELMKRLHEEGAIAFHVADGRWDWDLDAVRAADPGENVVDFMVASLRRLPDGTQQALQLAACIGSTFDLETLGIIYERSIDEAGAQLREALARNLVVPLHDSYALVGQGAAVNPVYKFQHDRIQQAAYALIAPDRRAAVHLSIGRLIQRHGLGAREEHLMDVVRHLDEGRALISDPAERRRLAELNLKAGVRARSSSAYASALGFLDIGQQLLGEGGWDDDFDLTLALATEYQLCAYLTGRYAEAEAWTERMLARVATPLQKAEILSVRTRQYATMGRMRESIQSAIAGLTLLGTDLTEHPGKDSIAREVALVQENLAGRSIPDLIDAPPMTAGAEAVAIRLLMEIFPAAFLSGSGDMFPYLVLKSVNLSLRHGNSPESAFAYAAYGMLLCGALDDPALGYQYGRLAVAMNDQLEDIALKSRVIYVYAMFVHHWSNHWSTMTPWFLRGIEAGTRSGDLLYLAYSAQDCVIWDPTLDLETAAREQQKYLSIVRDCEYQDSLDSGTLFLQMQLNFLGRTRGLTTMDDDAFDEGATVARMRARRFMTGIANYQIYKAEIHAFYGEYAAALEYVEAQEPLIASSMSLPQLVRFYLVAFLTRAALFAGMDPAAQPAVRARLTADLDRMARWADHCAANFAHLRDLMLAELARLDGRLEDALTAYERSAEGANASGFLRDEATANELAGRALVAAGRPKAAEGYLRAARYLYDRWGAARKVAHMEAQHPRLLNLDSPRGDAGPGQTTRTSVTSTLDASSLDMASVMRASQAISGEILIDQLWHKTLQILLENAGAQKGWLVVRREGGLMIEAVEEAAVDHGPFAGSTPVAPAGEEPVLPLSILHNVLRSGAALVLHDAATTGGFQHDPYIARRRPRSVICIPIQRHGAFEAVIYMENSLTSGAFTRERIEVIRLLAAQATISMENAKLYEDQLRLTAAQRRFVPRQFLESLGHHDLSRVGLGEVVAKEMSVMFSDLRGFTGLSERLAPAAVIQLLNRYFSSLEGPISAAGGFIDSFNGDEVMALFDVPVERAVAAGVEMCRALAAFNQRSAALGDPQLRMGVGVNTGELVLGTVGGVDRLKCGVVGDTVNLASRIEQLTKTYDASFLIGDRTYRSLPDPAAFSLRRVDCVTVQGKAQVVTLYEVLDAERPERRAAKEATRGLLDAAMSAYFDRRFAEAVEGVAEALALDPGDRVLTLLAERAGRYAAKPPPADWQGFEALQHK